MRNRSLERLEVGTPQKPVPMAPRSVRGRAIGGLLGVRSRDHDAQKTFGIPLRTQHSDCCIMCVVEIDLLRGAERPG